MPTTIKLKNSVTTTSVPSSLVQGEVAINITDKKVWVGNAATTPIQLLGGGADGNFTNISVSSVATFGAGTVSAPSITTSGDTNTGMFFPAADTIAFTEGGAEAMRLDSSGNMGLGTTGPSSLNRLTIDGVGTAGNPSSVITLRQGGTDVFYVGPIARDNNTDIQIWNPRNGYLQFATNNTERMRIDSSGNVGIGTSSPSVRLEVVGTDGTAGGTNTLLRLLGNIGGTNKSGGLFFRTLNSTTIGTERIAIIQSTDVDNNNRVLALNSAGGNVLIGTTTNNASGGVLQVSNGITFPATQSASSDANTLDDYEQGTWTPSFLAASGSATYTNQQGSYVKIGRQVTVTFYITVNVSSSLTTQNITGLPFTGSSTNYAGASFSVWSGVGGYCTLLGLVGASTNIQIRSTNSATGAPVLNTLSISNGAEIAGSVTYFVAD